jgi:hypothetical protein
MWRFHGSARNAKEQGPFSPSALIRVGFVCDLLAYGHVDCAASPNTRGKS